jgi:hypothetical protein
MENNKNEVFREVPGYEDLYLCSNKGRLFSKRKGEYKTPSHCRHNGVWNYKLYKEGKCKTMSCGRVVAVTFLENPNPKIYDVVIPKDGNQNDYTLDNLMWATRSYSTNKKFERNPELKQKFRDRFSKMAGDVRQVKMTPFLTEKLIHFRTIGYSVKQLEDIFPIKREQIRNILKQNSVQ